MAIELIPLKTEPTAPALARRSVRKALEKIGVDVERIEDAVLVTSELVTNALEHGRGVNRLELEHDPGGFTIRVFDRSLTAPELRVPEPTAARSRGLQLVSALSAEWGHFSLGPRRGKVVWARFPTAKLATP